jgi:hypothetical protein
VKEKISTELCCKICKESKSAFLFTQHSGKYRRVCKECSNRRQRAYRIPDKNAASRLKWCKEMIEKNPRKFLWYRIKWSAKARHLDFNLDVEDFVIPNFCEILGIPISISCPKRGGARRPPENSASVDRLDSKKGYVKGNIKIISHLANSLKSNGTAEQHEKIADYMRRNGVK